MKKLALVILAGISFATSNAQIQIGAKAGFNLATLNGSDAGNEGTIVSWDVGGFARIPLVEKLSWQPELLYSAQGGSYDTRWAVGCVAATKNHVVVKYAVVDGLAIET